MLSARIIVLRLRPASPDEVPGAIRVAFGHTIVSHIIRTGDINHYC
jgi:hypothetical protein